MKKFLFFTPFYLILSLFFKLMHWPGVDFMAIMFTFTLMIFAIVNMFTKSKDSYVNGIEGWIIFIWSVYFLFRFLNWNTGREIYGLSILFIPVISITLIYAVIRLLQAKVVSKIVLVVGVLGFTSQFIPDHQVYYFFSLNETINKKYNSTNFYGWDEYAWLLFKDGKEEEALEANQKAIQAWHTYKETYPSFVRPLDNLFIQVLEKRTTQIEKGIWDDGDQKFTVDYAVKRGFVENTREARKGLY